MAVWTPARNSAEGGFVAQGFTLDIPQRRRNYRFALTPLADAMFQLLIFFMLSTGITPYSLLALQSAPGDPGAANTQGSGVDAAEANAPNPGEIAVWMIRPDGIKAGGQVFGYDALDVLAEALGSPGAAADVVLVVEQGAKVQDIALVLSRLESANVDGVQISARGAN